MSTQDSRLPAIRTYRRAFAALSFCISASLSWAQATTYVYTGVTFNQFDGIACPPACHITGSFIVPAPLAPNLVQTLGGSGAFAPTSFTFTDGVTTFTQLNTSASGFAVHTDASGNIIQWGIYMIGPGGGAGLFLYYGGGVHSGGGPTQEGVNISSYQVYFMDPVAPGGAWSLAAVNSGDIREAIVSYTNSATPVAVTWTPAFPDPDYTATCTAETAPSDFLLPTITSRSATGMTVSPTDGGSGPGVLDCIAVPDFDATDMRHGRAPFSGFPQSVTVTWNLPFADTNYTAVCTVETEGGFSAGFTGTIDVVNPQSVDVVNAGYPAGTMHCIGVPDSDSSKIRHVRVAVSGSPLTVTVPWSEPFTDAFYAATCKEVGPSRDSDSAIAIQANSKTPASMQVINEIPQGTLDCIGAHLGGDLNGDGLVNCIDAKTVTASFGKRAGQPGFDPHADVNGDGIVNVLDLAIVSKQVAAGTTCH